MLSIVIAGNYYAYDSIAPVADLLRTGRGLSQTQIGMLNAVFSLPNIFLALVGGILIDRYGPARVSLWTAGLCCVGTVLNVLQNVGLAVCNMAAGWLNDAAGAGPANPAGFDGMLWFFGVFGFVAFAFVALLWLRESGPLGRGLESGRARL